MEQDDEEFEQLLHEIPQATSANTANEIPRATSAPPHLEELQRVYGQNVDAHDFGLGEDEVPVKPFIDIRCDEQYEDFYKSYSGAKKLPPPMDNRTLYNDLPVLSPKAASSQLSPFFAGLQLDSPRTRHRKHRQLEAHHKQQQAHHQQQNSQQQQREPSPNHHSAAAQHHFGNSSQNQMFAEVTSAFGNLNFDGNGSRGLPSMNDKSGDNLVLNHSSNGGLGNGSLSNGHGVGGDANGIYNNMDAFGLGSGGSGYGVAGSGASLETYTARSPPSINLFPKKPSGGMEAMSNGVYSGMGDYPQVSSQVVEKLLRQSSPGLNMYASARGEESYGSAVAAYQQHQQQQQQQQLEVLEVMHAAARGQAVSAAGTDFFSTASQQQFAYDYDVAALYGAQRMQVDAQAQAQAQMAVAVRYAQMEDEKRKQQQRLILQQHQQQLVDRQSQLQLLASLQAHQNGYGRGNTSPPRGPRVATALQHSQALQKLRQHQAVEGLWATPGLVQTDNPRTSAATSICRYYNQGYCSRGDVCPFLHSPSNGTSRVGHSNSSTVKDAARIAAAAAAAVTRDERFPVYPEKILQRRSLRPGNVGTTSTSSSIPSGIRRKGDGVSNGTGSANGHAPGYSNGHISPGSGHVSPPYLSDAQAHKALQDHLDFDSRVSSTHNLQQQQPKYTKLEEVEGRIYLVAKDQHGCRFLQKKFDEGGPEDVGKIFNEIIGHITELMKDPFGNYLVQKLLEVCDESQRIQILQVVTMDGELVKISLNMHGYV
jgi:hypothetical protein